MRTNARLILPASADAEKLLATLQVQLGLHSTEPARCRQVFYDTFDWRLYRARCVLCREGEDYCLRPLGKERVLAAQRLADHSRPRFWWDFPAGRLRKELRKRLSVRSLLQLAAVERHTRGARLLDARDREIGRLDLEEIHDRRRNGVGVIQRALVLVGDSGHEDGSEPAALAALRQRLAKLGLDQPAGDMLQTALAASGVSPGGYSARPVVQLVPEMPARLASCRIMLGLLRTMRQNEAGIIRDIDTEFLHDFRVAIRRTRSALGQIKGVFPVAERKRARSDFARLSRLSGRLRDLDVALLAERRYRRLLPASLVPGLELLFHALAAERVREHEQVAEALRSPEYRYLVARWRDFLQKAARDEVPPAGSDLVPVGELARKLLSRRYRSVLACGRRVADDSPPAALHELRIECKKLRHLLEFFASLLPETEVAALLAQLRRLQDNLGKSNDLRMQQAELMGYLEDTVATGSQTLLQAAAIGGLVTRLSDRQKEVREDFTHTFHRFSRPRNVKMVKRILTSRA